VDRSIFVLSDQIVVCQSEVWRKPVNSLSIRQYANATSGWIQDYIGNHDFCAMAQNNINVEYDSGGCNVFPNGAYNGKYYWYMQTVSDGSKGGTTTCYATCFDF